MRNISFVMVLCVAATMRTMSQSDWLQRADAHFTILYRAGYERDVELAEKHLRRALDLMKSKYGVSPASYSYSFFVHPAPTKLANVNAAHNVCCKSGPDGMKLGEIHYLAPSSPLWKGASRSSLGLVKDSEDYHAKIIVHEYIMVGHYAVQDQRPMGGWRYYDAPRWFTEGLQEYDAIFHSTDENRPQLRNVLFRWVKAKPYLFSVTPAGIIEIRDEYNGGAAFMAFLADRFGEDIHARILRDASGTFYDALSKGTSHSAPELFSMFREWLNNLPV